MVGKCECGPNHGLKAKVPGHTRVLPEGALLKRELRRTFREQRNEVLRSIKKIKAISDELQELVLEPGWNAELARRALPALELYAKQSGKDVLARLGLGSEFAVKPPKIRAALQKIAFDFATSTNATTNLELKAAHAQLKLELEAGILGLENSGPALREAVQRVFTRASNFRAKRIAESESSRAVHLGQRMAAEATGVVKGYIWLLSSDPCKWCLELAARFPEGVGLHDDFGTQSSYDNGPKTPNPAYEQVDHPPLHPNCQCTLLEIVDYSALATKKEPKG